MIQALYFLADQRIGINQIDNRICDRKENIGKKWNINEKYILVIYRSQWKIRTFFF
jgi:hypothetical protein